MTNDNDCESRQDGTQENSKGCGETADNGDKKLCSSDVCESAAPECRSSSPCIESPSGVFGDGKDDQDGKFGDLVEGTECVDDGANNSGVEVEAGLMDTCDNNDDQEDGKVGDLVEGTERVDDGANNSGVEVEAGLMDTCENNDDQEDGKVGDLVERTERVDDGANNSGVEVEAGLMVTCDNNDDQEDGKVGDLVEGTERGDDGANNSGVAVVMGKRSLSGQGQDAVMDTGDDNDDQEDGKRFKPAAPSQTSPVIAMSNLSASIPRSEPLPSTSSQTTPNFAMSNSNASIPMSSYDSTRVPAQDSSALMNIDEPSAVPSDGKQNGGLSPAEYILQTSQNLLEEIQSIGLKVKHHEDNMNLLKTDMNKLDEAILDKQVILGNYTVGTTGTTLQNEEETSKQILRYETSAANILCQLMERHGNQASLLPVTKDVLGVVAKLGSVDDDNLNRLFSEYLGLENMMAIVCRTYQGAAALEIYDKEGCIDKNAGFQGLAASVGRTLEGRYHVICLERLRPYPGEIIDDDPQRRLNLLKPKLPNGECPPGFLGFAVNMIEIGNENLMFVSSDGYGLRETLFYTLFSRVQVYKTRSEMLQALPLISEGALSLDGGMIKRGGIISFGNRVNVSVRFSKSSGSLSLPEKYLETENQIKEMKLKREKLLEDMQRERKLLEHVKSTFQIRKQEYLTFISKTHQM